jgi:hypothetical protein
MKICNVKKCLVCIKDKFLGFLSGAIEVSVLLGYVAQSLGIWEFNYAPVGVMHGHRKINSSFTG